MDTGVVLDEGPNGKHIVDWHHLNGEILMVAPGMIEPKRPMGCQCINTHNVAVSEVFNCNTHITIGGPVLTLFIMQQYTVAKILKQMMLNINKLSVILQTNVC